MSAFGIEVVTGKFLARLPDAKLERVIVLTGKMLQRISARLRDLKPRGIFIFLLSVSGCWPGEGIYETPTIAECMETR